MAYLIDPGLLSLVTTGSALGVGWKLKLYRTGTSVQINSYPTEADAAAGTNANAWPLVADAAGVLPQAWITETAKGIVTDAADVVKRTRDPMFVVGNYVSQSALDAFEATIDTEITALDARVTALEGGPSCLITPILGQSLTLARANQITSPGQIVEGLLMPYGGPEWTLMTSPAPLSSSSRPVVPSNFATFVPWTQPSGKEGLPPGMAWQLQQVGYSHVIAWSPGEGGTSLSLNLAGGGTGGGGGGPYFANLQAFLYFAVKWARSQGLEPVIQPVFIQGHGDAEQLNDGGTAGLESTQAQYVAGLTKLYRDVRLACTMALGSPWTGNLWLTPLLTGAGTVPYTLTGRKQVVAGQLQAGYGVGGSAIAGIKLLPPHSQFAALFETDLVHPSGQAFRYYGEVLGLMIGQGLAGSPRSIPYMTAKSVISGTQVKVTFSEAVQVSSAIVEATTSGVKGGLEAYTAGGVQIPLTAVAQGANSNEILITMASTATFSVVRNGLAQESTGAATAMPRTRIASPTPLGTAQDGTSLLVTSIPQEL